MKILVLHIPNTYNYGSMMMAENLITYLNQISDEKIEYFLDVEDEANLNRMKEATGYNNIYQYQRQQKKYLGNKISRNFKRIKDEIKEVRKIEQEYDKIIYLGGDDFSEYYINGILGRIFACFDLIKLKIQNKNGKVILLGQTVGPYTGILKMTAKFVFPKIKVYARDSIYIDEMYKKYRIKAIESRDLAFLDLNLQKEYMLNKNDILKEYQLDENQYITVVGTEFLNHYSDEQIFIEKFKEIILKLKKLYPTKKIVWLSHVTSKPPRRSDNYLLNLLNKKYDGIIEKNMIIISEDILPVKARIILGNSYFVITCRMHAAVSTFQMNKPAICLSYSPKYKGVISDGLGMGKLVIEAKGNEFWKEKIIDEVLERIRYIEEEYLNIQTLIRGNVLKCEEKVTETLKELIRGEKSVEN